jgi:hypothetical protein
MAEAEKAEEGHVAVEGWSGAGCAAASTTEDRREATRVNNPRVRADNPCLVVPAEPALDRPNITTTRSQGRNLRR